jgi:two-component system, OmpR family, alkaline phosphatase synthesis response regulator PhoP
LSAVISRAERAWTPLHFLGIERELQNMSHKKRILLIEDDEDVIALVKLQAEIAGYKLIAEIDGIAGLRAVERDKPDIVLLDIMLPGQSGLEVCRKMKIHPELRRIPTIMLTAKTEEAEIIAGLELGADDYVVKPFSPKVLFSRIKSVLRRIHEGPRLSKAVAFGEFTIDVERYVLKKGETVISVTLSEFEILRRLIAHRGKVLTRNQLLENIQDSGALIVDRNIDVHIAALRKKLGPGFDWVETVRGIGYRFKE